MQANASRARAAMVWAAFLMILVGCGGGDDTPAVAVAPAPTVPAVDATLESTDAAVTTDPAAEAVVDEDAAVDDASAVDAAGASGASDVGPVDSGGQPLNGDPAADPGVPPGYEGRGEVPAGGEGPAADEGLPPNYHVGIGRPTGAVETTETPSGYERRGEMPAGDLGTPPAQAPQDALAAAKAGFGQLFNSLTGNTPPQPATLPDGSPNPAAADYHAQLAELLFDAESPHHELAVLALLDVKPSDVSDKKVRARIAQGYKHVAMETSAHATEAVRGLVTWGGKFSAPLLITMLQQQASGAEEAVLAGLGELATPEAAEAVVNRIAGGGGSGGASSSGRDAVLEGRGGASYGSGGSEAAMASLRQMGAVAEAPLLAALPFESPEANQSAIEVLGDIGTKKSVGMLRRASKSENEGVADAALEAVKKVQERTRAAAEDAAESATDGKAAETRRAG